MFCQAPCQWAALILPQRQHTQGLTDAAKSTTAFSHEQKALLNWQATLQHLQQHNTP